MRGGQNEGFPQGGNASYKRLSGCEVPIFLDFLIATFIRYHYPGRDKGAALPSVYINRERYYCWDRDSGMTLLATIKAHISPSLVFSPLAVRTRAMGSLDRIVSVQKLERLPPKEKTAEVEKILAY